MLSYTARLKEELTHVSVQKNCCRHSELSALAKTCGELSLAGRGRLALLLETEYEPVAGRIMSLFKQLYSYQPDMIRLKRSQPRKMTVYNLSLESSTETDRIMIDLGLAEHSGGETVMANNGLLIPPAECCIGSALRGAFLGCGVLTNPNVQYQLEFSLFNEQMADNMTELLALSGISCGWISRAQREVIYVKEIDSMVQLLGLMGAHKMLLELENIRVLKDVRNNINRRNNCDTANIDKTVTASLQQAEAIQAMIKNKQFQLLSQPLRQIAELRLNYPDSSLQELADLAGISKSAANNRLRKIKELAQRIK